MDPDIHDEMLALAAGWDRAMIENDADAIGRYMADDWTIVGSDGSIGDKATFLALVKTGVLTHDAMTSEDMLVRSYGETAITLARGVSGGTHGNPTQGSVGTDLNRDRQEQGRTTGMDPVNKDREMNRDTEVGQRGSGSGQSGRDSFGSDRSSGTSDTSRNTGRGDRDITE